GQTVQYTYDPTNQYLLTAKDYNGYTTSYTYDMGTSAQTNNALLSVTNPDGTQQLFTYDARGRLSTTSLQGGALHTSYGYGVGGILTVTNTTNDTTTYFFDNRG